MRSKTNHHNHHNHHRQPTLQPHTPFPFSQLPFSSNPFSSSSLLLSAPASSNQQLRSDRFHFRSSLYTSRLGSLSSDLADLPKRRRGGPFVQRNQLQSLALARCLLVLSWPTPERKSSPGSPSLLSQARRTRRPKEPVVWTLVGYRSTQLALYLDYSSFLQYRSDCHLGVQERLVFRPLFRCVQSTIELNTHLSSFLIRSIT